jgi:hypothetical protein
LINSNSRSFDRRAGEDLTLVGLDTLEVLALEVLEVLAVIEALICIDLYWVIKVLRGLNFILNNFTS